MSRSSHSIRRAPCAHAYACMSAPPIAADGQIDAGIGGSARPTIQTCSSSAATSHSRGVSMYSSSAGHLSKAVKRGDRCLPSYSRPCGLLKSINVYTNVYTNVYAHVCTNVCTNVYMCLINEHTKCLHMSTKKHRRAYLYKYLHKCVHKRLHKRLHKCIHNCLGKCTHKYLHTCPYKMCI